MANYRRSNNHPNLPYPRLLALIELHNKEKSLTDQIEDANKYLQSLTLPFFTALFSPHLRKAILLKKIIVRRDIIMLKNDLAVVQAQINFFVV